MAAAALIAVGILSLMVCLLSAALLELFRDVRQIRDALGILDRPLNVEIGPVAGTAPSSYGLPAQIEEAGSAIVLFLSDKCSTCRILAAGLGGTMPAGLWMVVEGSSGEAAARFVELYGMTERLEDKRVTVDVAGAIGGRLRLDSTPVGYRVENGLFKDAVTVPSMRTLLALIPTPLDSAVPVSAGRRSILEKVGIR